ncbi:unnamed protein product [Gongylonema pulchrum]|uniref:RRM domain-containing protein n=1 Tax=Gongylonema pulchrum TaxID=637853 RepID=A0A183DMH1_9BILA|nr:unnamed protein product [Gongylonema pulchrum]
MPSLDGFTSLVAGFVDFEEMDRMVADRSDGIDLAFERGKGVLVLS